MLTLASVLGFRLPKDYKAAKPDVESQSLLAAGPGPPVPSSTVPGARNRLEAVLLCTGPGERRKIAGCARFHDTARLWSTRIRCRARLTRVVWETRRSVSPNLLVRDSSRSRILHSRTEMVQRTDRSSPMRTVGEGAVLGDRNPLPLAA